MQTISRSIAFRDRNYILHGRPGDPYFDHFGFGDHSNDFLLWCLQLIEPDDIVFDVGANIGGTVIPFSQTATQGQVFAFEPSPGTIEFLRQTVSTNAFGNVKALPLALGDSEGVVGFFDNTVSTSASHMVLDGKTLGVSNGDVRLTTIDAFVQDEGISRVKFIKIDVEGHELAVLDGASQTLATHKPNVFMEFNSFTLIAFGNQNPRFVLERMLTLFPYVYRFEGGVPIIIRPGEDVLAFIHDNLIKRGCVDDILCRYMPL